MHIFFQTIKTEIYYVGICGIIIGRCGVYLWPVEYHSKLNIACIQNRIMNFNKIVVNFKKTYSIIYS